MRAGARDASVRGAIVMRRTPTTRTNTTVGRELQTGETCHTAAMIGRRSVALLCVLLAHALAIYYLSVSFDGAVKGLSTEITWTSAPDIEPEPEEEQPPEPPPPHLDAARAPRLPEPTLPAEALAEPGESSAITDTSQVDWPLEGKLAAEREVKREMEAERIAKMFAGPGGTWASLTKRQRSKLNKFHFKPGVDGLEYDEKGNQIYHISDGCMIVNSGFIACKIGKVKIRGDMFENMREYFDEQRLPQTNEGNGTEPEALKPPY